MTVTSQDSRISYSGNGATTVFAVPFYFISQSDLKVYLRAADGTETLQALTTNYTTSGAGVESGGTLTFLTAPPSGTTVVIYADPPLTQETDYTPNGRFPAESHERALDKAIMIDRRTRDLVSRALSLNETDTIGTGTFNAKGQRIINVGDATGAADAMNQRSVDARALTTQGGAQYNALLKRITNMTAGVAATDAVTVAQAQEIANAIVAASIPVDAANDLLKSILNIRSYGAACDGVTDDSDWVEDAIDAANTAGGNRIIWIPASTKITRAMPTITVDNVFVIAPSNARVYLAASVDTTFFLWLGAGPGTARNVTTLMPKGNVTLALANVTGLSVGGYVFCQFSGPRLAFTGATHSNIYVDNLASVKYAAPGDAISSTGIPASTTIANIFSPEEAVALGLANNWALQLSQAATATAAGVTLTVTPVATYTLHAKILGLSANPVASGTVNNPFTTNGTKTVRFAHTAHGRSVGDPISLTGAYIYGVYAVTAVPNANEFEFELRGAYPAAAGFGGTVSYFYHNLWIDTPLPLPFDPNAAVHNICPWTPLSGGGWFGGTLDGSLSTASVGGIQASNTKDQRFAQVRCKSVKSLTPAGTFGFGIDVVRGLDNTLVDLAAEDSGSAGYFDISAREQTFLRATNTHSRGGVFGPGLGGTYCDVDGVQSTHARARGFKAGSSIASRFRGITANDAGLTCFAPANGTRDCEFEVKTRGGNLGMWGSHTGVCDNHFTVDIGSSFDPNFDITFYASDQGNIVTILDTPRGIYNAGRALVRWSNGLTENTGSVLQTLKRSDDAWLLRLLGIGTVNEVLLGANGDNFALWLAGAMRLQVESTTGAIFGGGLKNLAGTKTLVGPTRKVGWGVPTGTLSRATFATYTAPTVSASPTQSEVQAIADALQVASRTLAALINDIHGGGAGSPPHGLLET